MGWTDTIPLLDDPARSAVYTQPLDPSILLRAAVDLTVASIELEPLDKDCADDEQGKGDVAAGVAQLRHLTTFVVDGLAEQSLVGADRGLGLELMPGTLALTGFAHSGCIDA